MPTYSYVEIQLEQANALADLTGIQDDLRQAREYAITLLKSWKSDPWLIEPLSIAILVLYARPFSNGVRLRLERDALAVLTDQQQHDHKRFIEIRNKHVAHSVNAYESSQPIATYCVESAHEEGITGIECRHIRLAPLAVAELETIVDISGALLRHVERRIFSEKARILPLVRTIPLDKLLKAKVRHAVRVTTDPVRARRQTKR